MASLPFSVEHKHPGAKQLEGFFCFFKKISVCNALFKQEKGLEVEAEHQMVPHCCKSATMGKVSSAPFSVVLAFLNCLGCI